MNFFLLLAIFITPYCAQAGNPINGYKSLTIMERTVHFAQQQVVERIEFLSNTRLQIYLDAMPIVNLELSEREELLIRYFVGQEEKAMQLLDEYENYYVSLLKTHKAKSRTSTALHRIAKETVL